MYKKTVIVELKKDYAIVIDEGGGMHRIKRKRDMKIGDRIFYLDEDRYRIVGATKKRKARPRVLSIVAAAAVFLLVSLSLIPLFSAPPVQAAISVGHDRGIQVEVDEDHKIKRILDSQGKELSLPQLENKTLNEAYSELVAYVEELGLSDVVISIASRSEKLGNEVKQNLLAGIQNAPQPTGIIYLPGNMDDYEEALRQNSSLAAYELEKQNITLWTTEEGQSLTNEEKQARLGDKAEYHYSDDDDDDDDDEEIPDDGDDSEDDEEVLPPQESAQPQVPVQPVPPVVDEDDLDDDSDDDLDDDDLDDDDSDDDLDDDPDDDD